LFDSTVKVSRLADSASGVTVINERSSMGPSRITPPWCGRGRTR
jgi:hypothetical protein